jgi:ubiquinone/menaquinone biosynthesis C-methylase UbiE
MGWRKSFWWAFFGKPSGPLGWVGARLLARSHGFHRAMAAELDLKGDDDLLDVGCGSAGLLVEQAAHVRHVAGLDASEIQISMARRRLADRVAAGTAELVLGDAAALPWEDGRFSVVCSLNCMKFVPDPPAVLREMHRVLRPGGRAIITMSDTRKAAWERPSSGTRDAWGEWHWTDAEVRRLVESAGFADIAVSVLPIFNRPQLARATRLPASAVTPVTAAPAQAETNPAGSEASAPTRA